VTGSLTSAAFCGGEGGFGGPSGPVRQPHELPTREPDATCDLGTLPQAALIYRLSGDYNPLHADPSVAASAGFKQPILHGLCTYGVAGYAVISTLCAHDPGRLRGLDGGFPPPGFPGAGIAPRGWKGVRGR